MRPTRRTCIPGQRKITLGSYSQEGRYTPPPRTTRQRPNFIFTYAFYIKLMQLNLCICLEGSIHVFLPTCIALDSSVEAQSNVLYVNISYEKLATLIFMSRSKISSLKMFKTIHFPSGHNEIF